MASAANDSSKRRRLLNDASPDAGCLSELPSGVLTHVANYLAPPSRALFAAALATEIAVASDERNSAIVGNEWITLDFGDIEKDLAIKLNDGDIEKVLQCIDATNRVKKLKLTNCINITGVGLEPLRGSTTIEQIDLSLVGDHQSPQLSSRPPISCEFVVPILDSIIEREGCSLRHLQFPSAWRGSWRSDRGFEQILRRYNEMLVNQGVSCLKCNVNLPPENGSWIENYGIDRSQKYTCYECLKYYCEVCTDDDDDYMLSYCLLCERRLCLDCQKKKWCNGCEGVICMDCTDFTDCSGCGAGLCKDCEGIESSKCCKCQGYFCETNCSNQIYDECNDCKMYICRDCDEEYNWLRCNCCDQCFCNECNEKKGTKAIHICDGCDTESCCGDCRVLVMCQVYGETKDCTGCFQLAGPLLLEEVKKVRKQHAEVKAENGTLKDANGYKQDHINYLKEQLQYQKEQVKELEEKMKQLESGEDG